MAGVHIVIHLLPKQRSLFTEHSNKSPSSHMEVIGGRKRIKVAKQSHRGQVRTFPDLKSELISLERNDLGRITSEPRQELTLGLHTKLQLGQSLV